MKKIITVVLAASFCAVSFSQQTAVSPELLKQKDKFASVELFESPAVFSDRAANASLLRDYEANAASYKPEQLLPVAVCYLSFGDLPKSKTAFESFLKTNPKNLRAIRSLGTISLLTKNVDAAVDYYKKAISYGDEKSAVFLGSAYIMSNRATEIAPYLDSIKKLAKENLEALNVVLIYAGRDKKSFDEKIVKDALCSVDVRKVMSSASPDGFSTILRLYMATRNLWPTEALVIPARAAALAELWTVSMPAYKKVLDAQPNNPIALRGMGLVAYRTGDVRGAADYIMKAYKAGEKDAAIDGVELFLLSRDRAVWEEFKGVISDTKPIPQVRAGLVQYAVGRDDSADIFYYAAIGANSDLLYKDESVSKLLEEGAIKYKSDARSSEVLKKLKELKPAAKSK